MFSIQLPWKDYNKNKEFNTKKTVTLKDIDLTKQALQYIFAQNKDSGLSPPSRSYTESAYGTLVAGIKRRNDYSMQNLFQLHGHLANVLGQTWKIVNLYLFKLLASYFGWQRKASCSMAQVDLIWKSCIVKVCIKALKFHSEHLNTMSSKIT